MAAPAAPAPSAWMSGVVKGVLSGDQLVIMGKGMEARSAHRHAVLLA
jgi:hypothetical protein